MRLKQVRPDGEALHGIHQVAALNAHPVAMFAVEDDPFIMEEAISAGISFYDPTGTPTLGVKPLLRAAVTLFHCHQLVRDDLKQAEKCMSEGSRVDRAKAIRIKQRRLSESDAYKWLPPGHEPWTKDCRPHKRTKAYGGNAG